MLDLLLPSQWTLIILRHRDKGDSHGGEGAWLYSLQLLPW